MKKISCILIIFVLMISLFFSFSFADEENAENTEQQTEQEQQEEQPTPEPAPEIKETVVNTYGKVTETSGVKEVFNGNIADQVQEVTIEIIEGDYIGEEYTLEYVLSYDLEGKMLAKELDVGDKVEVQITEDKEGNVTATINDVVRGNKIIIVCIIFLVSIVAIGGKKGLRAMIGLIFTLAIIFLFMIIRISSGTNAIVMSILVSGIAIFITFGILDGFNKKTFSAALGAFCGVLVAGIIALIFNNSAKMTGAYEDAVRLSIDTAKINFNFLDVLFAGILVSAIGACMDISMSIVTGLHELKMKDSEITWKELFKEGMKIGKNNIGTMVNTLILALLGGTLSLILLFMAADMRFMEILDKEQIAEQIITAIAGSIGVVYTVPITSLIYSLMNKEKIIYRRVTENKVDGKRSLKL